MKLRIIAHLDMDAFFAAIEERDRPKFKGLPIIVGADPAEGKGRGVVSTANYKAREYGIRSATPISRAWQLSEEAKKQGKSPAVFLFPNFSKYEKSSSKILEIIRKFSPLVEPAGIDEMYFDLSFCGDYQKAGNVCEKIKKEIKKTEKLTCSVGIGPNKLIAKIASDFKKPDGFTVVKENETEAFLEKMPVRKIPGIGPKTEEFLKSKKIETVKELKKFSQKDLKEMLGKWGSDLYDKIRGIDSSSVSEDHEVKSIGEQETFLKDTKNANFIFKRLEFLCDNIFKRFKESGFKNFKTIVITVRFSDFETKTKSHTLKEKTNSEKILKFETMRLMSPFLDKRENPKRKLIRLVGTRIEKLK